MRPGAGGVAGWETRSTALSCVQHMGWGEGGSVSRVRGERRRGWEAGVGGGGGRLASMKEEVPDCATVPSWLIRSSLDMPDTYTGARPGAGEGGSG